MAAGLANKTVGDGNSGTMSGRFLSSDGTSGGNLRPATTLYTSGDAEVDFTTGTTGAPAGGVSSVQGSASTDTPVRTTGPGAGAYDVQTTITRPANATAYTANDVLGGALDLGVLGPSAGAVLITGLQLEADITAIPSGQTSWIVHLYSVTPPSAVVDNGAWGLPSGDRASYLGQIPLATMVLQAGTAATCYVEDNSLRKPVRLAGTHLFAYLATVGGFTPAGNSEVYKLTVHTLSL